MCEMLAFGFPPILREMAAFDPPGIAESDYSQNLPGEGKLNARVGVPSVGSKGHDLGTCKPCAWEPKPGGCNKGETCEFCHMCEDGEVKKRKKERIAALRLSRAKKRQEKGGRPAFGHGHGNLQGKTMTRQAAYFTQDLNRYISPAAAGAGFYCLEKDSSDETGSTVEDSEEATLSYASQPVQQQVPLPLKLCRDSDGSLSATPFRPVMSLSM